jgi:hypothetical protein
MNVRNSTRTTVAIFSCLAALTGIEHGIGEILQGSAARDSIIFKSWGESDLFQILNGEPAMSLIPGFTASGILSIFFSLILAVWAIGFSGRKASGGVVLLLSVILLLVGGGFGPPLLGIICGIVNFKVRSRFPWWRRTAPEGLRRLMAALWPWVLGVSITVWLLLLPGTILIHRFLRPEPMEAIVIGLILGAFGSFGLVIMTAFARDSGR